MTKIEIKLASDTVLTIDEVSSAISALYPHAELFVQQGSVDRDSIIAIDTGEGDSAEIRDRIKDTLNLLWEQKEQA
jgi:hypothetical protein